MKNPLVSIIIPCYNYGEYLSATLEHLKTQTLNSWECIIVDDGSQDNTRNIATNFLKQDDRYSYIFQKNQGLSAARNAGIIASRGEFIQLLDADDLLSPKKLELQTAYMKREPTVQISCTDAVYFDNHDLSRLYKSFQIRNNNTVKFSKEPWMKELDHYGVDFFLWDNIAPVNSALIRRRVFEEVGYFNRSFRSLEDWDFWARCAFAGIKFSLFTSEEAYALIRVHTDSMTFSREKMQLYFLKLQIDTLKRLKSSRNSSFYKIYNENKQQVFKAIREYIRTSKDLTFKKIIFVANILGYKTFLLFYVKELNLAQKQVKRRKIR